MSFSGDQQAEAYSEEERREVLKLGPAKFGELYDKAKRMIRKGNLNQLTDAEREAFLKIPLVIRIKADDAVKVENY